MSEEKKERQKKLDMLEEMLKEVYEKHGKEYKDIILKKKDESENSNKSVK